jgi:hypothetical protein
VSISAIGTCARTRDLRPYHRGLAGGFHAHDPPPPRVEVADDVTVTSLGHVTSTFTIGSSRIGILAGYPATDIKVTLYDVMLFAQVLSRLRE